jgi:hypothetical protein
MYSRTSCHTCMVGLVRHSRTKTPAYIELTHTWTKLKKTRAYMLENKKNFQNSHLHLRVWFRQTKYTSWSPQWVLHNGKIKLPIWDTLKLRLVRPVDYGGDGLCIFLGLDQFWLPTPIPCGSYCSTILISHEALVFVLHLWWIKMNFSYLGESMTVFWIKNSHPDMAGAIWLQSFAFNV